MTEKYEEIKEDLRALYERAVLNMALYGGEYDRGLVRGLNDALCTVVSGGKELHDIRKAAEEEAAFYLETMKQASRVARNLKRRGSGFEDAFSNLIEHSDTANAVRIRRAFPELWRKYATD